MSVDTAKRKFCPTPLQGCANTRICLWYRLKLVIAHNIPLSVSPRLVAPARVARTRDFLRRHAHDNENSSRTEFDAERTSSSPSLTSMIVILQNQGDVHLREYFHNSRTLRQSQRIKASLQQYYYISSIPPGSSGSGDVCVSGNGSVLQISSISASIASASASTGTPRNSVWGSAS